jgi:hypothetical protein
MGLLGSLNNDTQHPVVHNYGLRVCGHPSRGVTVSIACIYRASTKEEPNRLRS